MTETVQIEETQPVAALIGPEPPHAKFRSWVIPIPAFATFLILYLVALILPLYQIQSRPEGPYNWDIYTAADLLEFIDTPTSDVLKINQGLMTTSGQSAVVVGPMWLMSDVFGLSFASMRIAMVLIAALAVPLTWLLGRVLKSDAVGLGAAVLVGTSQVFLLYSRTGTSVGITLFPAVLGFLLLWLAIRPGDRRWWIWLVLLQLCLIGSSYFYSPVRFLWPVALVLMLVEVCLRKGERRRLLLGLVVTAVSLPMVLPHLLETPDLTTRQAIRAYYQARGEQVLTMSDGNDGLINFVANRTSTDRSELEDESTFLLVQRLIMINGEDLANLLVDRNTLPAVQDYWNPHGRLYDRRLVPFFVFATIWLLWSFFRAASSRFLLCLFWGLSLPMLLTTNVHIGRLILVIPVLSILVMLPVPIVIEWLAKRRPLRNHLGFAAILPVPLCLAIAIFGAIPSLDDWFGTPFASERSVVMAGAIRQTMLRSPTPQIVFVHGDDSEWVGERLRSSSLQIQLGDTVRWVDLKTGEVHGDGPVRMLYHGMLDRLEQPMSVPGYCTNIYVIDNGLLDRFLAVTEADAKEICGEPLRYVVVP